MKSHHVRARGCSSCPLMDEWSCGHPDAPQHPEETIVYDTPNVAIPDAPHRLCPLRKGCLIVGLDHGAKPERRLAHVQELILELEAWIEHGRQFGKEYDIDVSETSEALAEARSALTHGFPNAAESYAELKEV